MKVDCQIKIQEQIQPPAFRIAEMKRLDPVSYVLWKVRERMKEIEDQNAFDVMEKIANENPNT